MSNEREKNLFGAARVLYDLFEELPTKEMGENLGKGDLELEFGYI